MIGFKLNADGDIEAENGKITLLSTIQDAVRQRLDIKLKTFQGEWFLNNKYGVPYKQQIFGKGLTIEERNALFIRVIKEDPDVQRIVYLESEYTNHNRQYSVKFEVKVQNQSLRSTTVSLLANEEVDYIEPDNYALSPSCTPEQFALVSNLYPYFYTETLEVGNSFGGMLSTRVIEESGSLGASFGGGNLQSVIIEYNNYAPESAALGTSFAGGNLQSVVITYDNYAPESAALGTSFSGGNLQTVVVNYNNYAPESASLGATFGGGSLEQV